MCYNFSPRWILVTLRGYECGTPDSAAAELVQVKLHSGHMFFQRKSASLPARKWKANTPDAAVCYLNFWPNLLWKTHNHLCLLERGAYYIARVVSVVKLSRPLHSLGAAVDFSAREEAEAEDDETRGCFSATEWGQDSGLRRPRL